MEGVFCQNSEWGLQLVVETDGHKRVSINISRQFELNVTRIRRYGVPFFNTLLCWSG